MGASPFTSRDFPKLWKGIYAKNRLTFVTDLDAAVKKAFVIFIAVGTPPKPDGSADLSTVLEVAASIGRAMDRYKVIVTKSTVPVGY